MIEDKKMAQLMDDDIVDVIRAGTVQPKSESKSTIIVARTPAPLHRSYSEMRWATPLGKDYPAPVAKPLGEQLFELFPDVPMDSGSDL